MERKKFFKLVGAGSLGAVTLSKSMGCTTGNAQNSVETSEAKMKVLMKVGCQAGGTTKENLEFKARCGVFNIDGGAPKMIKGVGWDLEDSQIKKEACEKYGITLEAYHLPLDSTGIDRTPMPSIMLGQSPERDKEIEILQNCIRVAGKTVLLCLGSIAEGLKDPKTEILPIIKWVGERNQIFNIHLRNIKGGLNNFQEVYPDNGDLDFLQIIRELRDVGYAGMLCPDHTPQHPDPGNFNQGFAFSYGYIKALIHAVSSEV